MAGSIAGNTIDISQGGNDTVIGGSGNDTIILGATLTADDSIDGGAGSDTVTLQGNYATRVTFNAATLTNVETLVLGAGFSYNLATNDRNIASGGRLTIDASALASINTATVTAAAELDGAVSFIGGAGNDTFTGGSGDDIFIGGLGADVLSGRGGADVFVYRSAEESAFRTSGTNIVTSGADTIVSFVAGADVIDLSAFGFSGGAASLLVRSTTGISNTTATAAGFFGTAGVAIEYSSTGSGRIYIDANRDGNLGAGDGMTQLFSVTNNSLTASSFKF